MVRAPWRAACYRQRVNIQPFHDADTGTFSYVVDDGEGTCAIIDAVLGFDAAAGRLDTRPLQPIEAWLRERRLRVEWLLETHVHADHLSGAAWLKARFGGTLAITAGVREVQALFDDKFPDIGNAAAHFDRLLVAGERFTIGRLQVEALPVPGHTPADLAYRVTDRAGGPDAVFVGDTLFMPAVGTARCDFPGGSAARLFRSVRTLLQQLPAETPLYVCHDYPAPGETPRCMATAAEHRARNVHVRDGVSEAEFVAMRQARDATLSLPRLIIPAIQVNLRAGQLPPPDADGLSCLRIPVNRF